MIAAAASTVAGAEGSRMVFARFLRGRKGSLAALATRRVRGWRQCRRSLVFAGAQGGTSTILFGLAVFPLLLAGGAAIDYGFANGAKAKLAAIADSAALAAVTREAMSLSPADARA